MPHTSALHGASEGPCPSLAAAGGTFAASPAQRPCCLLTRLPLLAPSSALPRRSYDYCQLPPPGSAINSKRGTAGPATNGNQDGVHNGAGLSDAQTTSQLQEVALTDKPAA